MADDLVEYLLDCDALLRASKRIETPSRAGITAYKAAADEITRLRAAVEAVREALARTLEPNGDNRDDGSNAFGLGVDWAQEQLLARYDALSPPPAGQTE